MKSSRMWTSSILVMCKTMSSLISVKSSIMSLRVEDIQTSIRLTLEYTSITKRKRTLVNSTAYSVQLARLEVSSKSLSYVLEQLYSPTIESCMTFSFQNNYLRFRLSLKSCKKSTHLVI